jgi:(E)-4-hydroxy-3-methylbut-2-enyl-diphosphate synthase
MGCVVNGPGESMEADLGIAGGKGEGLVYKKVSRLRRFPKPKMPDFLMAEIERMQESLRIGGVCPHIAATAPSSYPYLCVSPENLSFHS